MKPWNEELVKSVLGSTIENIMFETIEKAREKLNKIVGYLIKNQHVSDGQATIEQTESSNFIITVQLKDSNRAVMTYVYKISPNKIEEVKPFNFDLIDKPLAQLVYMLKAMQTVNCHGGYTSLKKLHAELKDVDFAFKKLKEVVGYESL